MIISSSFPVTNLKYGFRLGFLGMCIAGAWACYSRPSDPIGEITGTWGGDDAGLIATDSSAHVHIGCTLGDTSAPIRLDAYNHFDVTGTYNVDAYPVDRGIIHPARFTGQVSGNELTITVTLTDTGAQLGPATVVKGKEPKMGPCPICRKPGERRLTDALTTRIRLDSSKARAAGRA